MDRDAGRRAVGVLAPEPADPVGERRDARRAARPRRHRRAESRTRSCGAGSRRPNQVRRRPIATSSFSTGSSRYRFGPSSVGSRSGARSGEDSNGQRAYFGRDHLDCRRVRPSPRRARRAAGDRRGRAAGIPRRPRAHVQHRLRRATRPPASTRIADLVEAELACARRVRRAAAGPEGPLRRHRDRDVRGRARCRPAGPADRPHGHGLLRGDRRAAAVPHRGPACARRRRQRHEGRPPRRAAGRRGAPPTDWRGELRAPCRSSG